MREVRIYIIHSNIRFWLIVIFLLVQVQLCVLAQLWPVDGRIGGWNTHWQRLNEVMNGDPVSADRVAIFLQRHDDSKVLVSLKVTKENKVMLHVAIEDSPLLNPVRIDQGATKSAKKLFDYDLAEQINHAVSSLVLTTKYGEDSGRRVALGGETLVIGATSAERPFIYLMGKGNTNFVPGLSVVIDLVNTLQDYAFAGEGVAASLNGIDAIIESIANLAEEVEVVTIQDRHAEKGGEKPVSSFLTLLVQMDKFRNQRVRFVGWLNVGNRPGIYLHKEASDYSLPGLGFGLMGDLKALNDLKAGFVLIEGEIVKSGHSVSGASVKDWVILNDSWSVKDR